MKKIILCAVLLAGLFFPVAAQQNESANGKSGSGDVVFYGLSDYHVATGWRGGVAAIGKWDFGENYSLSFGAEVTAPTRFALDLRGSADLFSWNGNTLLLENRYLYRQYPDYNVQEFSGALQLGLDMAHWNLRLGLANRYIAELVQRSNGGVGTIFEPMNVMFAVEGWVLDNTSEVVVPVWNIGFRWSNYTDFVIERVSMWFYSVKGFYSLKDNWMLVGEAGIHPVGSLNLTSSYDGWYAHVGAKYLF